jgi:transposase
LGNPGHFKNLRQIITYAGHDPEEDGSGSRVGRKVILKKRRGLSRECLSYMALCAVILKLIRVLFALLRATREPLQCIW